MGTYGREKEGKGREGGREISMLSCHVVCPSVLPAAQPACQIIGQSGFLSRTRPSSR